jgi:hypothetical protein
MVDACGKLLHLALRDFCYFLQSDPRSVEQAHEGAGEHGVCAGVLVRQAIERDLAKSRRVQYEDPLRRAPILADLAREIGKFSRYSVT